VWIRTIPPEEARGVLARLYAEAVARAGRVFHVVRAMSLSPATLEASLAFYSRVMLARGTLSRRRRELLAVVVSQVNACHY
jgi:alkylhydroperoxidase family enzyme